MRYVTTAERIGMKKGIEKGIEKGRKKTAKNLLVLGVLTVEQIAQVTELSIEDVRKLQQELQDMSEASGKMEPSLAGV